MISNKYPKKKKKNKNKKKERKKSILITPLSNEEKKSVPEWYRINLFTQMFKIEGKQGAWAAQAMNNSRKFIFKSNYSARRQIIPAFNMQIDYFVI